MAKKKPAAKKQPKVKVKATAKALSIKTKNPVWKKHPLPGQSENVNAVGISANGGRVASGTYFFNNSGQPKSRTVGTFAWNAAGTQLWKDTFVGTADNGATSGVYAAAISRDGTWAASGGASLPGTGFIFAYEAATGSEWLIHHPPARTNSLALSTNGAYLVAGADALYLFSRISLTVNWGLPQKLAFASGTVTSVAISADGKWIVAAAYGGYVVLVENIGGAFGPTTTFKLASGWVLDVAISADGSAFVAGGSDGALYYFNIPGFQNTTNPAWSLALAGCSACRSVAISDKGDLVCAAASAGTPGNPTGTGKVFMFTNAGVEQWKNTTLDGPNCTSMDSTGQYVTVSDGTPADNEGYFYLFNGATGDLRWKFKTSRMCYTVQISADANAIAGGCNDGRIYYFSVP